MEIGNLCFAGEGTTSTTLTYLFWELTRHPEWQTRVREELLQHSDIQDSQGTMPILEAVINEALRLHPAAPASLLRIVPAGGAELAGYHLPPKVRVAFIVAESVKISMLTAPRPSCRCNASRLNAILCSRIRMSSILVDGLLRT